MAKSLASRVFIGSSFSESGAYRHVELLQRLWKCTIITKPKYDDKEGMWFYTYNDPQVANDQYDPSKPYIQKIISLPKESTEPLKNVKKPATKNKTKKNAKNNKR